jgi:hypothetical protein
VTLPEPDGQPPIRGGWVGRQWPLLTVLGGGVVGILAIGFDHFRLGSLLLSISVLFAALARAVLPPRRVGLLVVRSRPFDVLVLAAMGVALLVLALIVPPAPEPVDDGAAGQTGWGSLSRTQIS